MKKLAWTAILLAAWQGVVAAPIIAEYFSIQDNDSPITWQERLRADTPLDAFNRLYISPAWLLPDANGKETLQFRYPYEEKRLDELVVLTRIKNPSAQIFITSGYDDGSMYQAAAKNPQYFAQSVVAFLRSHDLDGYDMDWEEGIDKASLDALLPALRHALDKAGKEDGKHYYLTFATMPYVDPGYDIAVMKATLDQINLMSYGVPDNIQSIAEAFHKAGFPYEKMIGGVETEYDYSGGVDTPGPTGTIRQKCLDVTALNLAGLMAWRMDNDYDACVVSTCGQGVQHHPTYVGAYALSQCFDHPAD